MYICIFICIFSYYILYFIYIYIISAYIGTDTFDSEIRHIDSPDNSEMITSELQNSESLIGQDLTSIINGEEYDSVREYLENELENTDITNEIAKRSFKKPTKYSVIEMEVTINTNNIIYLLIFYN